MNFRQAIKKKGKRNEGIDTITDEDNEGLKKKNESCQQEYETYNLGLVGEKKIIMISD